MPNKSGLLAAGLCLLLAAGCSPAGELSDAQEPIKPGSTMADSPIMLDVYGKSVSEDVYSKGPITPP
ncbi:hypothetical protein FHS19_002062 [Paenibacillus rhizosphaerae]|uniref:Uncharacterized protein n=1 Tax=Paenibacillus rhizosphaerae TaxID=297318 RepID=A0A839TPU7_9BACL|nr:hypothetical protein [Paenibacillus rhizosphaerae]MBB3127408.1 hypothetical protein [Paenibacillus rhizosphaerae]